MKPILVIHEIRDRIFKLPLEDYILTFDDGLYSQYFYWDKFADIKTDKIFFITTSAICDGKQSKEFPTSIEAHNKLFKDDNREDFMTIEQIKFLMNQPDVEIGGHSHYHSNIGKVKTLIDRVKLITEDTEKMLEWFFDNLGLRPTSFCFPYNKGDDIYVSMLKRLYGFKRLYCGERIDEKII